ncbi:hypothetical protein ACFYXS_37395 [Streptomyces sp. NPDC002574]|uniref:hypothetical protein n=1 Tax=Streptomyces sp. NPDC002574 TaxID=3364652 RepID=UPI0036933576
MSLIVDEIQTFLPLEISTAEADEGGICLSGDRWRLRVNTSWRVSLNGVVMISPSLSDDGGKSHGIEELAGDGLVEVGFQSRSVGLDLSFQTRAGRVFEIFSDFPYGEWMFSLWSAEDEHQIPIFDLEGPVVPDMD